MNSWVWASTPTVSRISTRGRAAPAGAGDRGQPLDLVERVDDDPTDAGVDRPGQLVDGLVVAVQPDPLGRHVGGQRGRQLTAGAHVERQPFALDDADDRLAQERLAGVVDVGAGEPVPELPAPRTDVGLVQHVRRGAELAREVVDAYAADGQHAVRAARDVTRPEVGHERVDIGRRGCNQSGAITLVTCAPGRTRRADAGR